MMWALGQKKYAAPGQRDCNPASLEVIWRNDMAENVPVHLFNGPFEKQECESLTPAVIVVGATAPGSAAVP